MKLCRNPSSEKRNFGLSEDFDKQEVIIQDHRDLLMAELERNRPEIIIDTSPSGFHKWDRFPLKDFPELDDFVRNRYRLMGNVDGFHVYERIPTASRALEIEARAHVPALQ